MAVAVAVVGPVAVPTRCHPPAAKTGSVELEVVAGQAVRVAGVELAVRLEAAPLEFSSPVLRRSFPVTRSSGALVARGVVVVQALLVRPVAKVVPVDWRQCSAPRQVVAAETEERAAPDPGAAVQVEVQASASTHPELEPRAIAPAPTTSSVVAPAAMVARVAHRKSIPAEPAFQARSRRAHSIDEVG
jgi:hypothetical protein